ncbi:MAG: hypothetical protein WDO13_12920 [Verrucomicrobiota bacterium]
MPKRRGITDWIFASFCVVLSVALFLVPGFRLAEDLRDPALRNGAIPRAAWRLHENLAPRYAAWAGQRIASQRAARLDNSNVADTEWPLFGSVFYLLALESLQDAWRADPTLAPVAPNVLAHDAIESSVDLVLDPNHATWVKQKYGASYLDKDDLFYRFLRIAAMTSYSRLTGNPRLLETLRRETASLGAEVDRSPAGLLEDYPGECYPTDVLGGDRGHRPGRQGAGARSLRVRGAGAARLRCDKGRRVGSALLQGQRRDRRAADGAARLRSFPTRSSLRPSFGRSGRRTGPAPINSITGRAGVDWPASANFPTTGPTARPSRMSIPGPSSWASARRHPPSVLARRASMGAWTRPRR